MIIDALAVSLDVAVMLAVIITLVPVVADVADDEVVTELTDALAEAIENNTDAKIETIRILFFILSRPKDVRYINLLGVCTVCYICIGKYRWCKS